MYQRHNVEHDVKNDRRYHKGYKGTYKGPRNVNGTVYTALFHDVAQTREQEQDNQENNDPKHVTLWTSSDVEQKFSPSLG
jgi:hypothetical protein